MGFLKKTAPDIGAILFFLLISFAYFFTPVTQGLVLTGHDNTASLGSNEELGTYKEQTGEVTRWTNSLFSGMPTYQMAPEYGSRSVLSTISHVYELGLSGSMMFLFILLLGFYILLRAFNFKSWMAALGAVLWAFSSYFFIIIAAGHLWKVLTLAFIPPTIAGVILCYRGKLLWGGIVTALFTALQILSNHIQMSYYFFFLILFIVIAYLVDAIRHHRLPQFAKATGVLMVAALIGLGTNLSNLYHTYEYSKETMRGKSELAQPASAAADNNQKSGSGLSREYITQWSYGMGESWTLLVPNVKGGASGLLSDDPIVQKQGQYATYMQMLQNLYPQLQGSTPGISHYWGEQPGTSGPVYVGAFVCLLFILGLFIVRGPLKWALLAGTILSFLFAWGRNLMPVTDFFIDYLPLYNKFRTVASALVVAEFTIPLLAILALVEVIRRPEALKAKPWKFGVSFALTGGAALLFALFPGVLGNCITSNEQLVLQHLQQFFSGPELGAFSQSITAVRQAVISADAWRSFWIVLIGSGALILYVRGTLKALPMVAILLVLCLFDMWQVNKRYLNDSCYVEPWQNERSLQKTATDEAILQDKALSYRVLNLSVNTFNDNTTSYWHKSIGGYHAAKLRRYQDVIEHCLTRDITRLQQAISATNGNLASVQTDTICPVLNMLNMKYVIVPTQQGTAPVTNPNASGNGWFVNEVRYVDNAQAEMDGLKSIQPTHTAVVDRSFKAALGDTEGVLATDSTASVVLTAYQPNELTYKVRSSQNGVVVFSEVYYPGWTATLDGKPIEIARADYILRAVCVPVGEHTIVFSFHPTSITTTEAIAYTALALLLAGFVLAVVQAARRLKREA